MTSVVVHFHADLFTETGQKYKDKKNEGFLPDVLNLILIDHFVSAVIPFTNN